MDLLPILIVSVLVVAGYALTLAPIVPGTLAVLGAAVVVGFMEDFDRFSAAFWIVQGLLVISYLIVDNVAQHYGVKRIGGSGRAMWGGVVGVMIGPFLVAPFLGPLALFVGPPLGAIVGVLIGQALHRRKVAKEPAASAQTQITASEPGPSNTKLAAGAFAAYLAGTGVKLGIYTVQVILLVVAAW